jgi:antirestriction protein ArdC
MGAAFLCRMCALDSPETFENQAAYVQSWLKVFKGDTKIVMQASKQARVAVEFILSGQKVIKAEAGATATA